MAFDLGKITDKLKGVQDLTKNLPIEQIFTSDFMSKNTKFKTIEEFMSKAGITPDKLKGMLDSDGDQKLNKIVAENTNFGNLKEMVQKAISSISVK